MQDVGFLAPQNLREALEARQIHPPHAQRVRRLPRRAAGVEEDAVGVVDAEHGLEAGGQTVDELEDLSLGPPLLEIGDEIKYFGAAMVGVRRTERILAVAAMTGAGSVCILERCRRAKRAATSAFAAAGSDLTERLGYSAAAP